MFAREDGWAGGAAEAGGSFTVRFEGREAGRVHWNLLGEHNRLNALAALAAARHVGVPVRLGLAALETFKNVKRRMEVRGVVNGITVYDDFAHHPTAIETTIAGLRSKVGRARILAVLEPRSNTMKLGVMKESLPGSLKDAELVFCYTGGIGWDVQSALRPLGELVHCHEDLQGLIALIVTAARSGDHVLIMSNGGFGGIHSKLLAALDQAKHENQ